MRAAYEVHAPAANLSIDADLLSRAKKMDIKLSATLEQALLGIVKKRQAEEWLAANRVAIEAYNDDVEKDGVLSDGLRRF